MNFIRKIIPITSVEKSRNVIIHVNYIYKYGNDVREHAWKICVQHLRLDLQLQYDIKKNSSVKISNYMERHCLDTFRSTILWKIGPNILSDKKSLTSDCLHTHTFITVRKLWDETYFFLSLSVKTKNSNRLQMSAEENTFFSIFKHPEYWSGRPGS